VRVGKEESLDVKTMAENEDAGIETLILAFASDPVTRWKWPQAYQYIANMRKFIRAFGGNAFEHGAAFCTDDCKGVALWLPPGVHPDQNQMRDLMENSTSPTARAAGPAMLEQMAKYHPSGSHWYLPLIGVDPAHQGKGYGDALMAYALERCDRDKLPAYLECTSARSIPLYRRHGFEPLGSIQAGSSPTLVPMLRRSR
jgi:GNAT superfamily N-acetyltransferase